MGLFSKGGSKSSNKSSVGVDKTTPPPPVFNKHREENLRRSYSHGRRASASLSGSFASLGSSLRVPVEGAVGTNWNSNANANSNNNSKFVIPDFGGAAKRANSTCSAGETSYIEEIIDDEDSFEEEIIIEEQEYVEEEFIEIIQEDLLFPPREATMIRFDEYDEMQTTLHINDFTKHEISKAWFKREDYDKMVKEARKTVEKVQERQRGSKDASKKASHEVRGLEAWSSLGSAKSRMLKESAFEAVWNEQQRQWAAGGESDPDKVREAYQALSMGAQTSAKDRGFADTAVLEQIRREEEQDEERKGRRKLLGKSKALLGKSMRMTTGGVVRTGRLVGKTTKLTGKVALGAGKAASKTAVATATLDGRMLKEALTREKKNKKEVNQQITRQPSRRAKNSLNLDGKTFF
jgi:hypothetical protein